MEKTGIAPSILSRAKTFLGRAAYAVNILLCLFLAFQLFAAYMFFVKGSAAMPEYFEKKIIAAAEEEGFILSFSKIELFFDASAEVRDVSVRFAGTPEPFIKAGKITVELSRPALLVGLLKLKSVEISEAYACASYEKISESPAVESAFFHIYRTFGKWHLRFAELYIDSFHATARGTLDDDFDVERFISGGAKAKKDSAEKPKPTTAELSKKWDEICAHISKVRAELRRFDAPSLSVNFETDGEYLNYLAVLFAADNYSFKNAESSTEIENIKIDAGIFERTKTLERAKARATFRKIRANSPQLDGKTLSAERAFVRGEFDAAAFVRSGQSSAPVVENFHASFGKISYDFALLEDLTVKKTRLGEKDFIDGAYVFARYGNGSLRARLGGGTEKMSVDFSLLADADKIMRLPMLSGIEELKEFSFPSGVELAGKAELDFKTNIHGAWASLYATDCTVMNIPVDSLRAEVSFSGADNVFEARNAHIRTREGWNIAGDVYQNLENMRYIFIIRGNIAPMRISHFMAPWWKKIFSRMEFRGDSPKADAYVEGVWGAPEFIWCTARVDASKVESGGVVFENFGANVLVNPRIIALHGGKILDGDNGADFSLQWHYGEDGITRFKTNTIDAKLKLTQPQIHALAGKDVDELFSVASFAASPEAEFHALMHNPFYENQPQDIYNAQVSTRGPAQVDNIMIDDAVFAARVCGGTVEIDGLTAVLCGGGASGRVRLDDVFDREKTSIALDLQFQKLDQENFFRTLAALGKTPEELAKAEAQRKEAEAKGEHKNGGAFAGLKGAHLSGKVSLGGLLKDTRSLKADGDALLENDELGRLHLLGMLSRAISGMGTNLGSFDITKMQSAFTISNGEIVFDRVNITGPKAKIIGMARYDFVDDRLRARLMFSPFGSMTTPVVSHIFTVIDPLVSVFEASMDGPLENPNVGIALRPMNFFGSEESILRDFAKKLSIPFNETPASN